MCLSNFCSKVCLTKSLKKKFPKVYKINAPIESEIAETKVPIHCPNNIPEIINNGETKPRRAIQNTAKIKK